MMKGRKWTLWLAVACLLALIVMPVWGHEIPDVNRLGSICLTLKDGETPLKGGTMTLYRVGDIAENDGNYFFVLTEELKPSKISLDSLNMDTAKALTEWLGGDADQKLVAKVDEHGQVKFADLKPGLYLAVQEKASSGYLPVDPFLVSVPMHDETGYIYDVEATPKVGKVETAPTEPDTTKPPPKDPQLPQTGQNNWPVPVLACLGLAFVMLGAWLCRSRKPEEGK